MLKQWIFSRLVYWLYRILLWSWKIHIHEPNSLVSDLKKKQPLIMAHWHGDELGLLHLIQRYSLSTMTSTSKDGSLIDFVIHRLGGYTSRGSSTRGGVSALKGLVKLMKLGHPCSIAVDGPKGPLYKAKPGVFEISRLGKAKIYPVSMYCTNAWKAKKSWNQALLPKPFSHIYIYYGDPLEVVKKEQDPRDPTLANALESSIHSARQQAHNLFAGLATQ